MRRYLLIICLMFMACSPEPESHQHSQKTAQADKHKPGFQQALEDIANKPAKIDLKEADKGMKRVHDGPLRFSRQALDELKDATLLSRYICEATEAYLEDRSLIRQQFSTQFMLATMSGLPVSLQRTYATCYLEKALRTGGFKAYFTDEQGLLVREAMLGYADIGALDQLKLLKQAYALAQTKAKTDKEYEQILQDLAKIDKRWHQYPRKQLLKKRAALIRERIEANAWPIN